MDKWFNVENYVKFMCDRIRSEAKRAVKKYTIEEFYNNYSTIIHDIAICADCEKADGDTRIGRYFPENGMYVHDCEVLSLSVENAIAKLLTAHQEEMVQKSLELSDAEKRV
jgi:major vault protein